MCFSLHFITFYLLNLGLKFLPVPVQVGVPCFCVWGGDQKGIGEVSGSLELLHPVVATAMLEAAPHPAPELTP